MIAVLPAATPVAGTVSAIDELVAPVLAVVSIFLTKKMLEVAVGVGVGVRVAVRVAVGVGVGVGVAVRVAVSVGVGVAVSVGVGVGPKSLYVTMAAAQLRFVPLLKVPLFANVPVAETIRNVGYIVMLVLEVPVSAEAFVRFVKLPFGVYVASLEVRASAPVAPIRSSSANAVVVVVPELGVVLRPGAVEVLSTASLTMPENSAALTAFEPLKLGKVTVIESPFTRAVASVAENTTVRTPVPLPLVPCWMSASAAP